MKISSERWTSGHNGEQGLEMNIGTWDSNAGLVLKIIFVHEAFLPNSLTEMRVEARYIRRAFYDPMLKEIRTFLSSIPSDIAMRDLEKRINTLAARFENPYS